MHSTSSSRKCQHCGETFRPDYRNCYHQRFCSKLRCRRASKQASQQRWLRKAENRGYFGGMANVRRVQEWRRIHPDYWKNRRRADRSGLQEKWTRLSPGKNGLVPVPSRESAHALQEFCRQPIPLLLGLIAQVRHCTLQEEIAACVQEMIVKGQCILNQSVREPPGQSGVVYRQADLFLCEHYEKRRSGSFVTAGD